MNETLKSPETIDSAADPLTIIGSLGHELRTPLNAILGYTGILLMKLPGPLNKEQEQQLEIIRNSARHLVALVNNLLDVARLNSGELELQIAPVSCREVINQVLSVLRPLAEFKGVNLEVCPGNEPWIMTDRLALSQIVVNLVANAIKFTESGGQVSIALAKQPGGIELNVSDTGIGIREQDRAAMFKPFCKISGSRAEGSGMGLHLSRKIARRLGGEITFRSEYGKGSTFTLVLREKGEMIT